MSKTFSVYCVLAFFSAAAFATIVDPFDSTPLTNPAFEKLNKKKIEQFLRLSYQFEGLQRRFERRLHKLALEKLNNPKLIFDLSPTTEDIALNELAEVWRVQEQDLVSAYADLAQLQFSSDTNERREARRILRQIHEYLSKAPIADQVVLTAFRKDLLEIQSREMASLDEISSLIDFERKLTQMQDLADQEVAQKAESIASYDVIRIPENVARELPNETPIEPSIGSNGVVNGSEFSDGTVALTYDDGPDASIAPAYFQLFADHKDAVNKSGVFVSYFYIVQYFYDRNSRGQLDKVMASAIDAGHSINSHSWSHPTNFGKNVYGQRLGKEVTFASQQLKSRYQSQSKNHGSNAVRFFRCPGLSCNRAIRSALLDEDMILADVTPGLDTKDYSHHNAKRSFQIMCDGLIVRGKGIILLHEIVHSSFDATVALLDWIKEQNDSGAGHFRLITLDQAVDEHNARLIKTSRK